MNCKDMVYSPKKINSKNFKNKLLSCLRDDRRIFLPYINASCFVYRHNEHNSTFQIAVKCNKFVPHYPTTFYYGAMLHVYTEISSRICRKIHITLQPLSIQNQGADVDRTWGRQGGKWECAYVNLESHVIQLRLLVPQMRSCLFQLATDMKHHHHLPFENIWEPQTDFTSCMKTDQFPFPCDI